MGSRASRGKILKILKRKYSQEESSSRASRASRGKFLKSLKRKDPQDPQEEIFSRGKFLKSLKRKDPQDLQDQHEERFSRGFTVGVSLHCCALVCCSYLS